MIHIKNFVHDFDSSTITFEVERNGVTNHVETRDSSYGTTATDIDEFTEDWSDSEYEQLDEFLHGCQEIVHSFNINFLGWRDNK